MSSELFEYKCEDFRTQFSSLRRKLDHEFVGCKGEDRKQLIRDLERGCEDATILVHEMEEEVKRAPASYRMQMNTQVRNFRRQLDQLQRDVNRANSSGWAGRAHDFDPENDFQRLEETQRARLMAGTQAMQRASDSVARSQAISAETDAIGEGIIGDLGEQRESLVRTRDRLIETQQNLSRSRKILNSMGRRLITNKLLLIVIIFLELCVLGLVVYFRFFT